ncbi:hypothetical protein ASPWEDRAFT_37376 [Aspergillus wentii DTO 134E9]|uniref:Uncharacterized protein n=1 Tax=Aspergillus wentii DTO 134E9 TaxID=1073089 RepID=A0A1L9RX93_ASPWE|nr:uncharacterized protein ASPWEDRAFT_37376 [Aspergillus wentii DTO 134E9]KAI9931750.1 hypothetical protein MW887_010329 [Aspergillus wentii]OJJ39571.1 hypothetical protein ASPWEDRAFT_37376 [Aspergillus wentii DTO 134E9]
MPHYDRIGPEPEFIPVEARFGDTFYQNTPSAPRSNKTTINPRTYCLGRKLSNTVSSWTPFGRRARDDTPSSLCNAKPLDWRGGGGLTWQDAETQLANYLYTHLGICPGRLKARGTGPSKFQTMKTHDPGSLIMQRYVCIGELFVRGHGIHIAGDERVMLSRE